MTPAKRQVKDQKLISKTSLGPNGSSSKRGPGFADTLLRPRGTNLLSAIIGVAVLAVCGVLLYIGYSGLRDDQAASIKREAEKTRVEGIQHAYDADVRLFEKKESDYSSCLSNAVTRVDGRDDLRGTLFDFADGVRTTLEDIFPGDAKAAAFGLLFAKDRHQYINDHYPALGLKVVQGECTKPGDPPPVPPELQ